MKKGIKFIATALFAAAVFASAPGNDIISVNASAAEKITSSVDYDYYGTAFLTITPSSDANIVYYTTDGSAPDTSSEVYEGEIVIYEQTLVRMAEYTTDGQRVSGIKKTVKPRLAPVTFKITQDETSAKAYITLECVTPGAEIHYTTDGTAPDKDSPVYDKKITITGRTKIRAKAYCDGYTASSRYSKTVDVAYVDETKTDTIDYKFTYFDEKGYTCVTLQKSKASNTIRYTTDGSIPTKSSKKYTKRVKFDDPGVIRAREYNTKGECVATLKVNVKIKCAPVTFKCIGIDTGVRTIEMHCATPGATIRFTTTGQSPKNDEVARTYTGPLVAAELTDIMAYAEKDGYKDGSVAWEIANAVDLSIDEFDYSNPIHEETAALVNACRYNAGSPTLILDDKLTKAAYLRAKELSAYTGHKRPNGKNYTSVFGAFGANCTISAEYYASYCNTPAEFLDYILSNPDNAKGIKGNIFGYEKIGIGYYKVGDATFWILLMTD